MSPRDLVAETGASCDRFGRGCWAHPMPRQAEPFVLVWDTPAAVGQRADDRAALLAEIGKAQHALDALQRQRARVWSGIRIEPDAAARTEARLALVARVRVLIIDGDGPAAVETMRELARALRPVAATVAA